VAWGSGTAQAAGPIIYAALFVNKPSPIPPLWRNASLLVKDLRKVIDFLVAD